MNISIFDLFSIGIGPSSSHTLGPLRAATAFAKQLTPFMLSQLKRIEIELHGSLAFTGRGHGTDQALQLGLMGCDPETIDPDQIPVLIHQIQQEQQLLLLGKTPIAFRPQSDILFNIKVLLPEHSNGLQFKAHDANQNCLLDKIYYSIGGGFIVEANEPPHADVNVRYPFTNMNELLDHCDRNKKNIDEIIFENEMSWRTEAEIRAQALKIWRTMLACIERGCQQTGILPGGLKVKRRAASLYQQLQNQSLDNTAAHWNHMNWLNVFAMAVNEENAAGARVVTAPTNGAAGIIPAVLHYHRTFFNDLSDESVIRYLLTAGAIGLLFKTGASISGAEMGCQGEVGVASSMAAGGLTAALGGSPHQIEKAAEIAIEHHLGLTCDPVDGLVQIPCIERNAMGANKALNAANLAMNEPDVAHKISLDEAIVAMREIGHDMLHKYKETSQGGLAAVKIAVNVPNC